MKNAYSITFNTDRGSLMEVYDDIITLVKGHSNVNFKDAQSIVDYFENIISCMPGNVYWLNKDSRTVGCNQNVLKMLGLKNQSEFYGLNFEQQAILGHWTNKQAESFKRDTEEVIRTGIEKLNVEEPPVPDSDGRNIYFLTSRIPLFNRRYDVIGVVGISIDITEHKHIQEALKKAEGKIDGMTLVSASIAHELRTPLAGVKSAVFGLENLLPHLIQGYQLAVDKRLIKPAITSDQLEILREMAAKIDKKVDQCNIIIDMLLTNLAQRQVGSADFEPCSIKECVNQALEKYNFTSGQRELIHVDIQNDFRFNGKETLIIHILFNLLKNSLYFIQKAGKGDIQIWAELGENGENYLHFKDTGQGIPQKNLPHIFDQFFTEDTNHGTGIGLAFSKMVMEAHHGDITCHSEYGQYAEFILNFPASRV